MNPNPKKKEAPKCKCSESGLFNGHKICACGVDVERSFGVGDPKAEPACFTRGACRWGGCKTCQAYPPLCDCANVLVRIGKGLYECRECRPDTEPHTDVNGNRCFCGGFVVKGTHHSALEEAPKEGEKWEAWAKEQALRIANETRFSDF
jgi:hypothetical protein